MKEMEAVGYFLMVLGFISILCNINAGILVWFVGLLYVNFLNNNNNQKKVKQ